MKSSNGHIFALLALCAGNSPGTGEFPTQRPVTWSFDVFFDLCPNRWLSKQWWGWWFGMPSHPLWCHCNGFWMTWHSCGIILMHLLSMIGLTFKLWITLIFVSFHIFAWLCLQYSFLSTINAHFFYKILSPGPVSQKNFLTSQLWWKIHFCHNLITGHQIATQFCTCHNTTVVGTCTKMCSNYINIWRRAK